MIKRIFFSITLFIIYFLLFLSSSSSAAVLRWGPVESTQTCVIRGYKVHYGTIFGQYTQVFDVGDVTFLDLDLLGLVPNQRYFLAISAYSTTNQDGPLSVSISYTYSDIDGDGIPDCWEQQIIDADPNDNIDFIEDVDPLDDFDGDCGTNLQEYERGTNPTIPDVTTVPVNLLPICYLLLLSEDK